MVKEGGSWTIK